MSTTQAAQSDHATGGESATTPLDPVTFEVIRHRLWAINDDQARMGARLSGSFIVYEGYDFNAALVTADGRGLYCGIYILQHGATIDEFVRQVLADRPAGDIREGDMFFSNDPWWGALHANDGILAMPIFWEGELIAWSGIVMHDDDVGSPVPGSFRLGRAGSLRRGAAVSGGSDRRELRAHLRRGAGGAAQLADRQLQRAQHARPRGRAADHLSPGAGADRAVRRRRLPGRPGGHHRLRRAGHPQPPARAARR